MREATPPRLRQADMTRALRAAKAAGVEVGSFEFDAAAGRIVIHAKDGKPTPANAFDKWKAGHAG